MLEKIRILLIEDNRIMREGILALMNTQKDFIVDAVSDAESINLIKTKSVKPHVVLLDMGLNAQNSLQIMEVVKVETPASKIIGMGLEPTSEDIMEFVQAGADGFVLKTGRVDDIATAVRRVTEGETVLPRIMSGSLFSQVVEHALGKGKRNHKPDIRMTQREKEVMALLVEGMSNKQIADTLCIATFTVKSHIHNIMEKLALHSRLQVANYASNEIVSLPLKNRIPNGMESSLAGSKSYSQLGSGT